ncbi:MAG: hypothetical protein RLZZ38_13 [Bacteroidota bacterium]|jgi:hypothetical protein
MIVKNLSSGIRRFFWGLILTQVPFLSNGQVFNELSTTLSLNNPAYHSDVTVHGKGFLSSDLKANTSIYFSTGANFVVSQNFLRYQLGLGKWKMGINNFHVGALGQNTFSYGFNLSRDIAISRDINLRVGAGLNQNISHLAEYGFSNFSYSPTIGLQLNYKDWSFYNSYGEFGFQIAATNRFELDSVQKLTTTLYYEKLNGFQNLNGNLEYGYKRLALLIGVSMRSYIVGAGYMVADQHQILLSSNWQRNLLSNGEQFNVQLGYHWTLTHRPTLQRFTGTPSF